MKKYKDPIKKSIRTLTNRSREAVGISCSHCVLLFDNPDLLRLHELNHLSPDQSLDVATAALVASNTDSNR